ncbi:hypothetical protein F4810DRAFT_659295, partial [Camillea tinctor]
MGGSGVALRFFSLVTGAPLPRLSLFDLDLPAYLHLCTLSFYKSSVAHSSALPYSRGEVDSRAAVQLFMQDNINKR